MLEVSPNDTVCIFYDRTSYSKQTNIIYVQGKDVIFNDRLPKIISVQGKEYLHSFSFINSYQLGHTEVYFYQFCTKGAMKNPSIEFGTANEMKLLVERKRR